MPTTLGRNLHMCFTKIKRPSTHHDHLSMNPDDQSHPFPSSSSSPSILIKNFNSLYDTTTFKSLSSSSTLSYEPEPDFATVVASQRFFFTTPGSSNSIIESSSKSWNNSPSVKDSVAVPTYSPDPYMDFRRSMQEMVEARGLVDIKSNWDYLHELLLCYLALNPKNTHNFIIGAFADLLVSLMSPPETEGGGGGGHGRRM
ncbi:hypothetical protein Ddye_015849 [Dipteronia dyeriana]|uniref:Transcription repressor n=1 Tax=Dipteronia dyeriana TaxID=168575 RepID=A0AAD9WZX4_9ROSI|nr:hypothetical protein Ddye_015849 [Dipteronia dyeriana]